MRSPADLARDDRKNEARLLEARARRLRPRAEEERKLLASVVTFRRAQGMYALSLTDLREIRPLARICLIPGASPVVPGIVHYRGELLSLHDLSTFAGNTPVAASASWVLVVEQDKRRIGLMADDVLDVVDIEVGGMQSVPLTLGDHGDLFAGMTRERVLVLDANKLFSSSRFIAAF